MKKVMLGLNQKRILVFEIILCLLVTVILLLTAHFIYANTFRVDYFLFILPQWIIVTFLNWRKEIKTESPKLRWFTFLLITIMMATFVMLKPNFSYQKGKDRIISQDYEDLSHMQVKSIFASKLESTFLVPATYLYTGEKNGISYYILLSPITGEIQTEEIGTGNYLDMYFELEYEQ